MKTRILLCGIVLGVLYLGCFYLGKWVAIREFSQKLADPANVTVELGNNLKAMVLHNGDEDYLVVPYVGVGVGMQDSHPMSCDTYVMKSDGKPEYGVRFNCPPPVR